MATSSPQRQPRLDLNPSSADRWMTCTASPKFILDNWDKIPPQGTRFSEEGTTAHEVASSLLLGKAPDPSKCPTPITPEMHVHAWDYMEYVQGLMEPGAELLVEQKLPLWYMPGRNAIVDAAVINRSGIHIVDYKYGEGVIVSTERNLQAVIYAVSVVREKQRDGWVPYAEMPISIHIYQPRGRAADDTPFHRWDTTYSEILGLATEIGFVATYIQFDNDGMMPTNNSDIKFVPSEKACRFCPAKGFCSARQETLLEGIEALQVIDDQLPALNTISIEQLTAIVKHGPEIKKWIDDANEYALDFMKAGNPLPGFKLVMSRGGNRYWRDPKEAAKLLLEDSILKREEVIEEKVISPAGAEKLLGKGKMGKELMNLIAKPPGQPVIATEDDKRDSALPDVSEFEKLEE